MGFGRFLPSQLRALHAKEGSTPTADDLRSAFEHADLGLVYVFDDAFEGVTVEVRDRISGGELENADPTHLWHAARSVWSRWALWVHSDQTTDIQAAWGKPGNRAKTAAARLRDLLRETFTAAAIRDIRDNWAEIQRKMSSAKALKSSNTEHAAATGTIGAKRPPADDHPAPKTPKAPKTVSPKPKPGVDTSRQMCLDHARHELVGGAAACARGSGCPFHHYALRGKTLEVISGTIGSHARTTDVKKLTGWAERHVSGGRS